MIKQMTTIKSDTEENWNKAINFIPKENEVIIYTDNYPPLMKIGDGKTKLLDLPYIGEYTLTAQNDQAWVEF